MNKSILLLKKLHNNLDIIFSPLDQFYLWYTYKILWSFSFFLAIICISTSFHTPISLTCRKYDLSSVHILLFLHFLLSRHNLCQIHSYNSAAFFITINFINYENFFFSFS